jgi:hypothetical protein
MNVFKKLLLLFLLSPAITFADGFLNCEGEMNVTFFKSEKTRSYMDKASIQKKGDILVIKGIGYLKDAYDRDAYFSETSLEINYYAKIPHESFTSYISGTLDKVTGKFTHKRENRSDEKINQLWEFYGDCEKTEPMI